MTNTVQHLLHAKAVEYAGKCTDPLEAALAFQDGALHVLNNPELMREQMHDLIIFIDSMSEEALTISTEDILNRYFNHLKQK